MKVNWTERLEAGGRGGQKLTPPPFPVCQQRGLRRKTGQACSTPQPRREAPAPELLQYKGREGDKRGEELGRGLKAARGDSLSRFRTEGGDEGVGVWSERTDRHQGQDRQWWVRVRLMDPIVLLSPLQVLGMWEKWWCGDTGMWRETNC